MSEKFRINPALKPTRVSRKLALFHKGKFTQYPFFVRFCLFMLLNKKKYALFHPHFNMPIFALTRFSHTRQKFLLRSTALF